MNSVHVVFLGVKRQFPGAGDDDNVTLTRRVPLTAAASSTYPAAEAGM